MASIYKSSIGKKLFMSITGLFLVIFLCLHATINFCYVIDPELFRGGCEFMALPIITVMTPILAAGFIIHFIWAFWLSYTNLKARGNQRYAVSNKAQADNWAAKNMLVLGIIVILGICLHLTHFWAKMQLQMFVGGEEADPVKLMEYIFGHGWIVIAYIVWFIALWFHLTHGFWSAFQTVGWNNDIWIKRLKVLGYIVATILCLMFIAVAVSAYLRAGGCCGCCGCC